MYAVEKFIYKPNKNNGKKQEKKEKREI